MMSPTSLSIDPALLEQAQAAATWRGSSLHDYIESVLRRASEADMALAASIREAEDSIERVEFLTQEEMEAWWNARHGRAAAE